MQQRVHRTCKCTIKALVSCITEQILHIHCPNQTSMNHSTCAAVIGNVSLKTGMVIIIELGICVLPVLQFPKQWESA